MKKLALFIVLLSLTACTSTQPQKPSKNERDKVLEKRNDVIRELPSMHAAEEWPR